MRATTVTVLVLSGLLVAAFAAARSLSRLERETVYQATERYHASGHADITALSFTYWSDDDPPLVPVACAKCHGTSGLLDFLGEDGSTPGQVDGEHPAGGVITCTACHNPAAHSITQVAFHSGAEVAPAGDEAVCMLCHQTRQSTQGLETVLADLGDDDVSADLSFVNPHYNFAASTQLGALAASGYHYPERDYAGAFAHAAGAQTCTECHSPHGLEVEPQPCAACHADVVSAEDFRSVRTQSVDYDGDGDLTTGIAVEIETLRSMLLEAIQDYARTVAGTPIVYADRFPYFFIDIDGSGEAEPDELQAGNRYNAWTPRLVRAAYNFQFAKKDPGAYVHNPRYVLQLLHDSIVDLGEGVTLPARALTRPGPYR